MSKLIDISSQLYESQISKSDVYVVYPSDEGTKSTNKKYILGADIPAIKFLNITHAQGKWVPDDTKKYAVGDMIPRDIEYYKTYQNWAKNTRDILKMNAGVCGLTLDNKPVKKTPIQELYEPVQLTGQELLALLNSIFTKNIQE